MISFFKIGLRSQKKVGYIIIFTTKSLEEGVERKKMEEEQCCIPMEIDNEDNYTAEENDILTITVEEENKGLNLLVSWLLEVRKKKHVGDIDPWAGFVSPREYSKNDRSTHQFKTVFSLSELKKSNRPIQISVTSCNKQSQKKNNQLNRNNEKEFYLYHLKVLRWDNRSGVDLGCKLSKTPNAVTPMMKKVVENMPNAIYGTFMVIKNGSTQDNYVKKEGSVPDGVALAERDFGELNSKFLKDFGCIEERHLARGCLEIPKNVAQQTNLDKIFSKLRKTTIVLDPYNEKVDRNNNNETVVIYTNRFFLVPCTSLIAWGYETMDASERATYGVYAIQIRSLNKNTKQVATPYWIVDCNSLTSMIYYCNERLIKNVTPTTLDDVGVTFYPFKNPNTWNDPMIVEDLTFSMSQEEVERVYNKKRFLSIKFVSGAVSFPKGLKEKKNLAPIVHSDFYDFRQFKSNNMTKVSQTLDNTNQKQKIN